MRKDALPITACTLVLGIFGAFLRWLQTMNLYEESGLARRGAPISWVLLAYGVLALAFFAAVVLVWLRRSRAERAPELALRPANLFFPVAAWVLAAVFVCCALVLMFTAPSAAFPRLQRVFGAAAIFGGLSFPLLPGRRDGAAPGGLDRLGGAVCTLFFCFWLIFAYKTGADRDPVLWRCGPEILAIVANTLAIYFVAAWYFSRPSPKAAVFFLQLAAFLDIAVFFDSRSLILTVMFTVCALLCLLLEYLVLSNLREN